MAERQRPGPGSPGLEVGATIHRRHPKTCGIWSARLLQEENTDIKLTLRRTVKDQNNLPILQVVSWSRDSVFPSCQDLLVLPEEQKLLLISIFYVMKSEEGNGN